MAISKFRKYIRNELLSFKKIYGYTPYATDNPLALLAIEASNGMCTNPSEYVYVICGEDLCHFHREYRRSGINCKIGRSKDPDKRLLSLQARVCCNCKLRVVHSIGVDHSLDLEYALLHALLIGIDSYSCDSTGQSEWRLLYSHDADWLFGLNNVSMKYAGDLLDSPYWQLEQVKKRGSMLNCSIRELMLNFVGNFMIGIDDDGSGGHLRHSTLRLLGRHYNWDKVASDIGYKIHLRSPNIVRRFGYV